MVPRRNTEHLQNTQFSVELMYKAIVDMQNSFELLSVSVIFVVTCIAYDFCFQSDFEKINTDEVKYLCV